MAPSYAQVLIGEHGPVEHQKAQPGFDKEKTSSGTQTVGWLPIGREYAARKEGRESNSSRRQRGAMETRSSVRLGSMHPEERT